MGRAKHGALTAEVKKIIKNYGSKSFCADDIYDSLYNSISVDEDSVDEDENFYYVTTKSILGVIKKLHKKNIVTYIKTENRRKYYKSSDSIPTTNEIKKSICNNQKQDFLPPVDVGNAILAYIDDEKMKYLKLQAELDGVKEQLKLERCDYKSQIKELKNQIGELCEKLQARGGFPMSEVARFIKK